MFTRSLIQTITIFVALTIAGVCLIVLPQYSTDTTVRGALPLVGTALFAGSLGFFLVEVTRKQTNNS